MKRLMRILGKGNKGKQGFTLIELMIVVIIVGILAAAAAGVYRTYVKKAYSAEAKATLGSIRTAELVHYAEHNTFLNVAAGNIGNDPSDIAPGLGIEVEKNTWFDDPFCFWVIASGSGTAENPYTFTATCDGNVVAIDHPEVKEIIVTLTDKGIWTP